MTIHNDDLENATEIARRLLQERFLTWKMGGLFPEKTTLAGIHRILEVGCGPGSWSLDVAHSYPGCSVVGIDCNSAMIEYAQSLKNLHDLPNVHFERIGGDGSLYFKSQHFDLITLHWNIFSLISIDWPHLLQECVQVARPGGMLRIVEEDLLGQTNCAAHAQFSRLCTQLLQQKIGTMAFDECKEATSEALLHDAGCETISRHCYPIDVSFGKEEHQVYAQCLHHVLKQLLPLFNIFAMQDTLDYLLWQVLEDLHKETFQGRCGVVIRCGEILPIDL